MGISWMHDLASHAMTYLGTVIAPEERSSLRIPGVQVDSATRRLRLNGHIAELSPVEFCLLECIASGRGHPVRPEVITAKVWGKRKRVGPGCLKFYIWRLRHKLEANPDRPQFVESVRGVGYRLAAEKLGH